MSEKIPQGKVLHENSFTGEQGVNPEKILAEAQAEIDQVLEVDERIREMINLSDLSPDVKELLILEASHVKNEAVSLGDTFMDKVFELGRRVKRSARLLSKAYSDVFGENHKIIEAMNFIFENGEFTFQQDAERIEKDFYTRVGADKVKDMVAPLFPLNDEGLKILEAARGGKELITLQDVENLIIEANILYNSK